MDMINNSSKSTLAFLLASLIFLSSCSTSYYASRYNHLDWVQKSGSKTPADGKVSVTKPAEDISPLSASTMSSISELPKPILESMKEHNVLNPSLPDKQKSKLYSKLEKTIEKEMAVTKLPGKIESLKNSIHKNSDQVISNPSDRLSGLDPDLRTGIIFIIGGLLLSILWVLPWPVGAIFGTLGTIAIVVGLIFILLYLLE